MLIQDHPDRKNQRRDNDCQNDRRRCWISSAALYQGESERDGECFSDRRVHQSDPTPEAAARLAAVRPARVPTPSKELRPAPSSAAGTPTALHNQHVPSADRALLPRQPMQPDNSCLCSPRENILASEATRVLTGVGNVHVSTSFLTEPYRCYLMVLATNLGSRDGHTVLRIRSLSVSQVNVS